MSATDTATLVESAKVISAELDKCGRSTLSTYLKFMAEHVAELQEAEAESLAVIDALSRRLAEVVLVMKGKPEPNKLHSYHDLGELCADMKSEVTCLAEDAMRLDAEREYWEREARGLRERIAGAKRVLGMELGLLGIAAHSLSEHALVELTAAELENPNG